MSMPITGAEEQEEEKRHTPRSLVRYRSSDKQGASHANVKSGARKGTQAPIQRASRVRTTEDYPPQVTAKLPESEIMDAPRGRRGQAAHPLVYLGLGMLGMLVLWICLSLLLGWGQGILDDMRYGRPRTFQMDMYVGHNEQAGQPSHFIALNLNRRIQVIEISGGDPAHTHVYTGPQLYGAQDDLVPVTLRFIDVNGDHRPDMIVSFQGTQIAYINEQDQFRPATPAEQPQIEHFLQSH